MAYPDGDLLPLTIVPHRKHQRSTTLKVYSSANVCPALFAQIYRPTAQFRRGETVRDNRHSRPLCRSSRIDACACTCAGRASSHPGSGLLRPVNAMQRTMCTARNIIWIHGTHARLSVSHLIYAQPISETSKTQIKQICITNTRIAPPKLHCTRNRAPTRQRTGDIECQNQMRVHNAAP